MWWSSTFSTCFRSSRVTYLSFSLAYDIVFFIYYLGWGEESFRGFHLTFIFMKTLTIQTKELMWTCCWLLSMFIPVIDSAFWLLLWLQWLYDDCTHLAPDSWARPSCLSYFGISIANSEPVSSTAESPSVSHGLEKMTVSEADVGQGTELGSQIFITFLFIEICWCFTLSCVCTILQWRSHYLPWRKGVKYKPSFIPKNKIPQRPTNGAQNSEYRI